MEALEPLLVGIIVAASVTFSVWRLLSVHQRLSLLDALGAKNTRLRARTAAKLASGCEGCSSGGAAKAPNRTPDAPPR